MTRQATAQRFPRSRPGRRSRLLVAVLALPLLVGMFAAPATAPSPVRGDELQRRPGPAARPPEEDRRPEGAHRAAQRLAGGPPGGDRADARPARGHHRGPRGDAQACRQPDQEHRRGPGHLPDARLPAERPQPAGRADRGPGDGQEAGAGRPQGRAVRAHPRRLRGRTDVAPRDLPVRRVVHGHARRDELPARRGGPGPRARGAGREGSRDAAQPPPDGRRDASGDEHHPPGNGGPEAEARSAAGGVPRGPGAVAGPRAPGRGRAARRARPVRQAGRRREADAPGARGDRGRQAQAPEQDQPTRREAVQPGPHPVQVQRDAAVADGRRRHPAVRLHRRDLRAAEGGLCPLAQRHRHRRPIRHAGSRLGLRAGSCTSAGTMPTGPIPPGS